MHIEQYGPTMVGTGAVGVPLRQCLALSSESIRPIESGDIFLPSHENWGAKTLFLNPDHGVKNTWFDKLVESFQPRLLYFVGGSSKVHGAALLRTRACHWAEKDSV